MAGSRWLHVLGVGVSLLALARYAYASQISADDLLPLVAQPSEDLVPEEPAPKDADAMVPAPPSAAASDVGLKPPAPEQPTVTQPAPKLPAPKLPAAKQPASGAAILPDVIPPGLIQRSRFAAHRPAVHGTAVHVAAMYRAAMPGPTRHADALPSAGAGMDGLGLRAGSGWLSAGLGFLVGPALSRMLTI